MKHLPKTWLILGLTLSFLVISCKKDMLSEKANTLSNQQDDRSAQDMLSDRMKLSNDVIIDWSNLAYESSGGYLEGHPLLATRIKAMMHIAMHDALNAIVPVYQSYAYHPHEKFHLANPVAACASAAYTVLMASYPDSAALFDAQLSKSLSNIPDGLGKTKGIALGKAAGNAIIDMRADDGAFEDPVSYIPVSTVPGVYNQVPPNEFVYGAFWKDMQTFSLLSHDQFRLPPPPALNSFIYTRDFNEIKHVGKLKSAVRTADQTAYAHFWYELQDIIWNRIAGRQATKNNTDLYTTARMFALLNMALEDSYISSWDTKFFYNFWRPYTAIRAAATDGNNFTKADPDWEPLMITPPVPDHASGHSTLGNAAATVLSHFYGAQTPFSTTSTTALTPGAVRSFESFKQAADENAHSRILAGIHFRFACDAGQMLGNKVGKWTLDHHLLPLH